MFGLSHTKRIKWNSYDYSNVEISTKFDENTKSLIAQSLSAFRINLLFILEDILME